MSKIFKKLLEAKKQFTAITKDQKNPHFRSAYYDINDLHKMVDPILHEQGLLITSPIVDGVMTTKLIDVETGESIESSFKIEYNANPQKVGSEITYYRRYLLSSLLGLQAEDDDGNKASTKKPQAPKTKPLPKVDFVKAVDAIKAGKVTVAEIIKSRTCTLEEIAGLNEVEQVVNNQKNK